MKDIIEETDNSVKMYAESINAMTFASNGLIIASIAKDKSINICDFRKGKFIRIQYTCNTDCKFLTLSPNGKTLAFVENKNTIKLFNTNTGKEISSFEVKTPEGYADWLTKLAFSPNGNILASIGGDGVVNLWKVKTGELIRYFKGHEMGIEVAFSQNGQIFAAGFLDETIKLWKTKTGKEIADIRYELPTITRVVTLEIVFSPDGKTFVSSGGDSSIKLWEIESGRLIKSFRENISPIGSLDFSSDGKKLVSVSSDNTIKLWDIESKKCLKTFDNQGGYSKFVSFLQDNKTFACFGNDGTLKFWNEENDSPLATLTLLNQGNWIVTTFDNRFDTNMPLDEIGDLPLIIYKSVSNMEMPDFKKFYFEKDLLKRIMDGEDFTPLTEISESNNSHPQIHIIEINTSGYTENSTNNLSDLGNSYEYKEDFILTDNRMITDEEYEKYIKPHQNTDVITVENPNSNITTSSITENVDGMVRVHIQILGKEILENSFLPFEYTVSMVIDELINALELPRLNEKEQEVNYILYSNYQNRYLINYETIQGAQIINDDTLQLTTYEVIPYENTKVNSTLQEVNSTLQKENSISQKENEKDLERREFFEELLKQVREHKIDFSRLKWRERHPSLRYKLFFWDGMNITLREYTKNSNKTKDDSWCEARHFGYIVQGKAEIDFGDKKVIFRRGDGICISEGTRHQMRLISKKLVIFHIDEQPSKD